MSKCFEAAIEALERMDRVKSEADELKVVKIVDTLREYALPAPCQPDHLMRLWDNADSVHEQVEYYGIVMQHVLAKFSGTKIDRPEIRRLFFINGRVEFVAKTFEVLLLFKSNNDFNVKMDILEELLLDDMIVFSALVDGSVLCTTSGDDAGNDLCVIERQMIKERFVTQLINLPTIVANYQREKGTQFGFLRTYPKNLYRNILKAFLFAAKMNAIQQRTIFTTPFLSNVLAKVVINYAAKRDDLAAFLQIMIVVAREEATYAEPIMNMLSNVNKTQAIETILITIFTKLSNWKPLLSPQLVQRSADWRFVVTKKIPLFSYSEAELLPKNLMDYLNMCATKDDNLNIVVLKELLNCWCQRKNVSLEQHTFVSRIIIYGILHLSESGGIKKGVSSDLTTFIKQKLYEGLPKHLQSLDASVRFIGMRLAEIVLNLLEEVTEEDRLDFKTSEMDVDPVLKLMFTDFDIKTNVPVLMNSDEVLIGLDIDIAKPKVIMDLQRAPVPPKAIPIEPLDSDDDDDEVVDDDDDDLVPYDMSNDVPMQELAAPKYLLDLKEYLLLSTENNQDNVDKFLMSLKFCAELIAKQLPLNDPKLGVELLSILLGLQNRVYNENFAEQRFEGCVAIVEVIPKEASQFLCEEFYTDNGVYAMSHRILILEVLGMAAQRLCHAKPLEIVQSTRRETPSKLEVNDEEAERKREIKVILSKRLAEKTKRYFTAKPKECPGTVNRFHSAAGHFIYPLLHGFGRKQIIFKSTAQLKDDTTNVLLLTFLKTLSRLILCAENAPALRRIVQELLHFVLLMRFYREEKVQVAVLEVVACVLTVTPREWMATDFLNTLFEIKVWLEQLVEENTFNPDFNKEAKELAKRLLVFL